MMLQFPRPHEDEILHSVIGRYGIRSGNTSHRAILDDVFSSNSFTACLELQPGVGHIISNLPVRSTITSDQLIHHNTLYLFYTAFRNAEQANSIFDEMLNDHGKDIHNAIGLMSSAVKPHTYFQYCPLCNQESLTKHGEMYWRRLHQIPSVRICVKHGIWLCESLVPTRGNTKHIFTVPTPDNCPDYRVQVVTDNKMLRQYSCIVNSIEMLLNCKYPNRPLEWFYRYYKNQLIRKGYASEKGRVDYQRVYKDFHDFYAIDLLGILQSLVSGESSWLKLIFQKHRKGFHPIRHLLVMQFLGVTLEDVFYTDQGELLAGCESKPKKPKRKIMKKTMTPEYRERAKKERREAWLQMRSQYPNYGRLELRKHDPKIYAWLYLYDREFLMEHLPERLPSKTASIRQDWNKRDQEILNKVAEIVQQMKSEEGKPRRLTLKRIQEIMGKQCLMPKHLKKMPLTKAFLEQVVEDAEAFRRRRVLWAIKELKSDNEVLTSNKIKIKAGVSKVESLIEEFKIGYII
ncbi:TnsD family Tn7-like transposition protein [Paenibacillus massiliensis]|uniref:TnsD family Tn7-like transposition protein n=1 Tax=Paenibacillus massiliensis TaxID=225917 RepID=UPI00046E6C81|nr:TnsD family Tn7-like transposition protein [Paenibacillus massiliensis]